MPLPPRPSGYTKRRSFWEAIITARKVAVVLSVTFLTAPRFPQTTSSALAQQMQLLVTLCIFIVALTAQVRIEWR